MVNYCFDDGNSWFNCVLFSHAGLADTTPTNTTVRDLPSGRSYRGCTTLHDTVIICGGRSDDNLSDAHIHYPDNDSHSHIVAPRFLTPGHGLHLWCNHSKQLDIRRPHQLSAQRLHQMGDLHAEPSLHTDTVVI